MQGLIVTFIVAAAAGHVAWLLIPTILRRRLIGRLIGRLTVVAPSRRAWLARLEKKAGDSACANCRGCAADAPAAAFPGQAKINVYRRAAGHLRPY